ncbi:MAG: rRNA maturation RNase YbeY [Thermomicrobiales bacterium]
MTCGPGVALEFTLLAGPEPGPSHDDDGRAATLSLSGLSEATAPVIEAELASLAQFVLAAEGATGPWEIVTALVSDAELQALHARFMDVDEPTDIMTFPYGDDLQGGDLAISIDHAISRAAEWNHAPDEELRFLVVHGVLHLLGWRDETPEQRAAMLERQTALIQAWRGRVSAS